MNPARNVYAHMYQYAMNMLLHGTVSCAFIYDSFTYCPVGIEVDLDDGFCLFDINLFYSEINMLDQCTDEYHAWRDLE